MAIRSIRVARTARYQVLEPAGAPARVLWALHGYGQLAEDFAPAFEPLVAGGTRVVVPEALSRFYLRGGHGRIGASWMTREDRAAEIADQLAYLDALRAELSGPDVPEVVLGFSQGAATGFRWAAAGEVRARRVVLVGGGVPPDTEWSSARARLAEAALFLAHGLADEDVTPERVRAEVDSLREHGLDLVPVPFEGGHELPPPELLARLVTG